MSNAGEIVFWTPVGVIVLAAVGVLWAPVGALICLITARFKNLPPRSYAVAGAKHSSLLLLPWFYLLMRMLSNNSLSMMVPFAGYLIIYAIWGFYVITWAFLFFGSIVDMLILHQHSLAQSSAAIILAGVSLPISAYALYRSVGELKRKYFADKESSQYSGDLPDGAYLQPFIELIGLSLVTLVIVTIVGLLGFVGT